MVLEVKEESMEAIKKYRLPRYHEIPDVGLYLNQVTRYINEYLQPFADMNITESMISNYVKMHMIANPNKKQYNREQIAYLIVIAVSKSVLSLDNIAKLLEVQRKTYSGETAYNYFCDEFENVLQYVFGLKESMETVGVDTTQAKMLFHNIIVTVAHKAFLEQCFCSLA